MLKVTLTILVVLISLYWVGEKTRRNPRIDAFLSAIEGHYAKLNERLEDSTTMNGLKFLRRFYGWLCIVLSVCLFAAQRFSQPNPTSTFILFPVFAFVFMGWFSIKWVTEHKNTIAELSKDHALMILCPLLMGIVDLLFGTSFMELLVLPFQQMSASLPINVPQVTNPVAIGGIITLVFLMSFGFYYLLTWIATVPVFLISVFTVVLPIQFARLLATIDRENTFFWLTGFVMIAISVWLTQL